MVEVRHQHTKAMDNVLNPQRVISSNSRVCMYPKDVQRIMGKTYTQARLYLIKIKKHLKKDDHQFVSVEEFSRYTGLPIDEVVRCIVG